MLSYKYFCGLLAFMAVIFLWQNWAVFGIIWGSAELVTDVVLALLLPAAQKLRRHFLRGVPHLRNSFYIRDSFSL